MASCIPKSCLQFTLAILKPDVASNTMVARSILETIRSEGFNVVLFKRTRLSLDVAKEFYLEHQRKFFYNRLTTFMSSSPIYVMVLAKTDAITSWRSLIGRANVYRTIYSDPECLRSRFGITDTRNAVHGSDSEATANREASFFFPGVNIQLFLDNIRSNMDSHLNLQQFEDYRELTERNYEEPCDIFIDDDIL